MFSCKKNSPLLTCCFWSVFGAVCLLRQAAKKNTDLRRVFLVFSSFFSQDCGFENQEATAFGSSSLSLSIERWDPDQVHMKGFLPRNHPKPEACFTLERTWHPVWLFFLLVKNV